MMIIGFSIIGLITVTKGTDSIECMVCHDWHSDNEFRFQI